MSPPLPLITLLSLWFQQTGAVVYTVMCMGFGAWRKGRTTDTKGVERRRDVWCMQWRSWSVWSCRSLWAKSHYREGQKQQAWLQTPLEEALTKKLPYTKTFLLYISGIWMLNLKHWLAVLIVLISTQLVIKVALPGQGSIVMSKFIYF